MIAKQLLLGALLALSLVALHCQAGGFFSNPLKSNFEGNRSTAKCPAGGLERKINGEQVRYYDLLLPRKACTKLCADEKLDWMPGMAQAWLGRTLFCCCKPREA